MSASEPQTTRTSTKVILRVGLVGCAIAYCLLGADFWAWHVDGFGARLTSRAIFPFFVIALLVTFISGSAVWKRYHGIGSILLFLGSLSVFLVMLLPQL